MAGYSIEDQLKAMGLVPGSMAYETNAQAMKDRAAYEADPANRAEVQRQSNESNAYRAAQTASMGMLTGTPLFSSGVADPAAAFERFSKSGYDGADAMRDGWLTGVGKPGWQQAGDQVALTGMYGGGQAAPNSQPATPATTPATPVSTPSPARTVTPQAPPQAMRAMYGPPKQPSQPAAPAAPVTPAHWDMGEAGAAGAWSNGYNPHWVGETQPPPSTPTQQPGQTTQPGQAQQPGATPAQPSRGPRAFGSAPRWTGQPSGMGGGRRFGQRSAMGNMYGGG